MIEQQYSHSDLDAVLEKVAPRTGWDFSRMVASRDPAPWEYIDVVLDRLSADSSVLDIGTGGGETFVALAPHFGSGLGIDIDPDMIQYAKQNGRAVENVSFRLSSDQLENVPEKFDIILDRHTPFSLPAIMAHLPSGGLFITQQVGERNMANVKAALMQETPSLAVWPTQITAAGLDLLTFREYDVRYAVEDLESLVFWLSALDVMHSDLNGQAAVADIASFNKILAQGVEEGRFVTNEHRYLAIARKTTEH